MPGRAVFLVLFYAPPVQVFVLAVPREGFDVVSAMGAVFPTLTELRLALVADRDLFRGVGSLGGVGSGGWGIGRVADEDGAFGGEGVHEFSGSA